jgi:hypothetical protein
MGTPGTAKSQQRKVGTTRAARIHAFVISCVAACALVAVAPAQAAPNGLDSSFGGDGKVTTDFAGGGPGNSPSPGPAVTCRFLTSAAMDPCL